MPIVNSSFVCVRAERERQGNKSVRKKGNRKFTDMEATNNNNNTQENKNKASYNNPLTDGAHAGRGGILGHERDVSTIAGVDWVAIGSLVHDNLEDFPVLAKEFVLPQDVLSL